MPGCLRAAVAAAAALQAACFARRPLLRPIRPWPALCLCSCASSGVSALTSKRRALPSLWALRPHDDDKAGGGRVGPRAGRRSSDLFSCSTMRCQPTSGGGGGDSAGRMGHPPCRFRLTTPASRSATADGRPRASHNPTKVVVVCFLMRRRASGAWMGPPCPGAAANPPRCCLFLVEAGGRGDQPRTGDV